MKAVVQSDKMALYMAPTSRRRMKDKTIIRKILI